MAFFTWLENTGIAEYVRVSLYGYPAMITLHAIGLAVIAGIAMALDLRLLGGFSGIRIESIMRLLGIAWVGFAINTISGSALFVAQATTFVHNPAFLIKITLVFLGVITVAQQQTLIGRLLKNSGGAAVTVPTSLKVVAGISLAIWLGAIVAGRLTAYV